MFALSIVLMVACAVLLFYGGLRRRHSLVRVTAFATALTSVFVVAPTILGFTLN
jgi:ammonia channel protein AmtB